MIGKWEFEDRGTSPWIDTSWYAVNLILHAIVEQTAKHYNKPLVVSYVKTPPGGSFTCSAQFNRTLCNAQVSIWAWTCSQRV